MKKLGFVLALFAAFSMTVLPVAPSYAAAPKASAEQALADHAARGNIAVLSQAQLSALAASNPALYSKITTARDTGKVPHFTAAEKQTLRGMTAQNMDAFKAGDAGLTIIIVVASVILLLLLWQPVVCKIFPWALGCAPPVVAARG
jgi:hypothetical protein